MRFLTYILLVISFPVYAQPWTGKDSIYSTDYQQQIYSRNFLSHNLSAPKDFGEVNLFYKLRTGNHRLAQVAQQAQQVDFYALGANQLGDFRISGDFLFNKVYEDSLSFGQRNDMDEWSTFNYFASKAGKYERQNYKANLTLSYKFKELIQPFFNVYYLSHWTTGSVDPRFESKKFEMKYNPGLLFNVDNTKLGVKAILGKGKENTGVSYKNKNYGQSLLFPDRVHYLNLGYGLVSIRDTANTVRYSSFKGLELTGHTSIGRVILDMRASVERRYDKITNDLKRAQSYRTRAIYEEDKFLFSSTMQILGNRFHQLIRVDGQYLRGHDGLINFSADFGKVNYQVDHQDLQLGYLLTKKNEATWSFDTGMDMSYSAITRNDYASNLAVSNAWLSVSPHIQLYYYTLQKDKIQLGIAPKLTLSVADNLSYSANAMNNYIKGVVLWDYDYYRTNTLQWSTMLRWTTKRLSDQYLVGAFAHYAHEKSISSIEHFSDLPKNTKRNYFSIGVFLNL